MIRVGVLYGGISPEYWVSLQSAQSILYHLDKNLFEVIPIHINPKGHWLINDTSVLSNSYYTNSNHTILTSFCSIPTHFPCEIIFSLLHGHLGENGSIQGTFETLGIPYVGSGVLGSAIGMNKAIAKILLSKEALVAIVPSITLYDHEINRGIEYIQTSLFASLCYPVFIKPVSAGSSVGIHKVTQSKELMPALYDALKYDHSVLVEQVLEVREIEVAVLENSIYGGEPLVSVPGEIIVHDSFYSYRAKYSDSEGASLTIPADLNQAQVNFLQTASKHIFIVLQLEGMARIDFFLDKQTQKIYFNEVNTIPGFTQNSMYPKLWESSGKSYTQLLTDLIQLGLARHKRKVSLNNQSYHYKMDLSEDVS